VEAETTTVVETSTTVEETTTVVETSTTVEEASVTVEEATTTVEETATVEETTTTEEAVEETATVEEAVAVEETTSEELIERPEAPPDLEGQETSTVIEYTLRFTGAPSLAQLVSVAVASAVYIVLSWLAIVSLPSGFPVVSAIFLAIGFGVPFAIWFGGWAFVIAYLGNFIGAGLLSNPPLALPVALWFGTTDLIQLGLPMLLYRLLARRFGVDPIGKDVYTVRGFIFFVLCAVLPNNIIGGLYGNFVLVQTGISPLSGLLPAWFIWSLSNVVVTLIIGSLLLKFLGPVVERFGLTVRNALS
jgi:hypothetical protein